MSGFQGTQGQEKALQGHVLYQFVMTARKHVQAHPLALRSVWSRGWGTLS